MVAIRYTWNPGKRRSNLERHGIDFSTSQDFEWDTAKVARDERFEYGEHRYVAYGRIRVRVHAMVFTFRSGVVHVISLRKANRREVKAYEEA
jgi:uncharacterized DUF497 family protein